MIVPSEVLFGTTVLMLEKLLDFQSQRHNIISTNIAHADTPGYKGHDLRFSDELKKAAGTRGSIPLRRTNERHLPLGVSRLKEVKGRLVPCSDAANRLDGNTVDLDKEMAKLAENSLYYNSAARILSRKMRSIRTAITEVR
jgi:flagellar basal-body rod protein FlgB